MIDLKVYIVGGPLDGGYVDLAEIRQVILPLLPEIPDFTSKDSAIVEPQRIVEVEVVNLEPTLVDGKWIVNWPKGN